MSKPHYRLVNGVPVLVRRSMRFLDYYNAMNSEQRREFARRVGTSPAYLFHVARGYRYPNGKLALAIIEATGGQVPAKPESFGSPKEHAIQPEAA